MRTSNNNDKGDALMQDCSITKNKKEASANQNNEQFLKIPYRIFLNNKINHAQKILFGVLNGFLEQREYVTYPNNKLATLLGCSEDSVDRDLRALEKQKIIERVGSSYRRKIQRGELFFNTSCKNDDGVESLNTYRKNAEVLPQKCGGTTAEMRENIDKEKDSLIKKSKDLKNACALDEKVSEKTSEPSALPVENVIKLPSTKKLENEVSVDPNYSYPETYFQQEEAKPSQELAVVDDIDLNELPEDLQNELALVSQSKLSTRRLDITPYDLLAFNAFMSAYPAQKGRKEALLTWFSEGCHDPKKRTDIMENLIKQVESGKYFKKGFIQTPANYLKGERWKDEVEDKLKPISHFNYQDISWMDSKYDDIFDKVRKSAIG